ncbi:MAG: SDR family NAD(P)-dependent oxidoreductase [Deltaproteobacteria bacterium]|nr:SDR family NAD(P)-dependent oxidoreductase [Deltaproteobacteria bacterium]
MPDLRDEIVFITGASAGIGAACARAFGAAGARLVLAARRTERLEALAREVRVPAHVVTLDARDRGAVDRAVAGLPADFAAVTVLVNNAGGALGLEPLHEGSVEDWEEMIDTNVKGLLYLTRALLPGMVARDRGHVVNMGSAAGSYPYRGGNVYCGAKAFVRQLSLCLRADLVGSRVRVTDIEPGLCATDFSLVRFHGDAERARRVYEGVKALGADDIAELVLFCVSRPPHVNINTLEVMPVMQAPGALVVKRA